MYICVLLCRNVCVKAASQGPEWEGGGRDDASRADVRADERTGDKRPGRLKFL